jgi:hypothetical protein
MAAVEWAEIRARLEIVAEELADLGRSRLHDALEDDDGASSPAAADERRLASARRAVLRAIAVLGGGEDEGP